GALPIFLLDRRVDGQLEAGAGSRGARVADPDRLAERVLHELAAAVAALEGGVARVLEAREALAVGPDRAEDLGREVVLRIEAAVPRRDLDPGDVQPANALGALARERAGEVGE